MPIGIDFGTTNSSITYFDADGSRPIEIGSGPDPYPAVLRTAAFLSDDDSDHATGREALGPRPSQGRLLEPLKPLLRQERLRQTFTMYVSKSTGDYDPVAQGPREVLEAVTETRYGDFSRGDVVTAVALLLGRMLRGVREQVPLSPEQLAVEPLYLGVPVGDGPVSRRRLLDALVRTGIYGEGAPAYNTALGRVHFMFEPLAVISRVQNPVERETVLVFDYGGGTLDLALWRVDPDGDHEELALGHHPAAGNRIDELLFEHLRATHPDYAAEVELSADANSRRLTMDRVSSAKEALSTEPEYELREGAAPPISVTRDDLERAIGPELRALEVAIGDCLERGGTGRHEVNRVVMTGGSSLMPAVRDLLWRLFPTLSPDTFEWPDPSDRDQRRDALTAISVGLAEAGWVEQQTASSMAPTLAGDLLIWNEAERCMERIARHGTPLDEPLRVTVRLRPGLSTLALYERIATERFLACLTDLRVPDSGLVELEISHRRHAVFPTVRASANGTQVGSFDVGQLRDHELENFLKADREWLFDRLPARGFLSRKLKQGDYVRMPGWMDEGVVRRIRDIASNRPLEQMEDWSVNQRCQIWVGWEGKQNERPVTCHADVHLR